MGESIHLAVRQLCEFLLHTGSIDNRFGGGDRAAEGSRIHRKLQKEAGEEYQAEVPLSLTVSLGGEEYCLEGRADGIFPQDGLWVVDEIKTVSVPLELMGEDWDAAHWGQGYCYGWMLARQRQLEQVGVRLTYYQADTGERKEFYRCRTLEELQQWGMDLLEQNRKWAEGRKSWRLLRDQSIHQLPFPFERYRPGQRELAVAVYRTIKLKSKLFCQAPTGTGKTISTLFPAVKAMGEGMGEQLFYLTAKTITRQAAEDAFHLLRQKGLRIRTITLTAKDKICPLEQRDCNPEVCPYADGYYDRVRPAVWELLEREDCFTRALLEEEGKARRLCPFELGLDLSLWCDCIICDYNYLFDPVVSLQRFFGEKKGEYLFLIDEAHNLPDRAREMYSAHLVKSRFLELKKALGKGGGPLRRSVRELNSQLVRVRKACGEEGSRTLPQPEEELTGSVAAFHAAAGEWLEEHREPSPLRGQVLERFFEAGFYLKILELVDESYIVLDSCHGSEMVTRLLCLDPARLLAERMACGRSTVLFSATLSPLDYYRDILGGGKEALRLSLASPFPRENLCLAVAGQISIRYKDREKSLEPVAGMLHAMTAARPGCYLAFFPSYRYMEQVREVYAARYPDDPILCQTGDMDEEAREQFLARLDGKRRLLGFCVMGGIFSEGVDLQGQRLLGAAIIGTGLPQIGPELELLRDYFQRQRGMGFDFAYRFPGMNKVQQAAGRVIRGETDRGVVLLIDSRFPQKDYQLLFPHHWQGWKNVSAAEDLSRLLEDFWKQGQEK